MSGKKAKKNEKGSKKGNKNASKKSKRDDSTNSFVDSGGESSRSSKKHSKSKKKSGSDKKGQQLPAAQPVPWYLYFCCFCILPKKFRKNKRKLCHEAKLKEKVDSEVIAGENVLESDGPTEPSIQHLAATKIQSIIRRYQAMDAIKEYRNEALKEANEHWMKIVRARELAWLEKERIIVARKQFALQYVSDVINTSLAFLSQTSEASTEIQRVWRGHKARSFKISKPVPEPPRPVFKRIPKIVPKSRFSVATLRRVWSRRDYQPANGKWLHTTDFGRLEYNMWEFVDKPPAGSDHGQRINKVKAVARSEREKEALVRDKHAWVGLPIGFETWEETCLKKKENEPANVTQLKSKSPYNVPVVNWDKIDAEAKEQERIKKETNASRKARRRKILEERSKNANRKIKPGGRSGTGDRSGMSGTSASERSGNEQSDFEVHEGGLIAGKSRGFEGISLFDAPLEEETFVRELKKFGFNPAEMDPTESRGLPRLGTIAYDIHSGRRIIHKGNNRWVGVRDRNFVVQYDMPAQAIAFDEAIEQAASGVNGDGSELIDPFGDLSLVGRKPTIRYHRSGAVTVKNPALLNKKSRFLREHRSVFLDNFTHHNLSEYSGLLSSTYFDLTVHADAMPLHRGDSIAESTTAGDDDITDFKYIHSTAAKDSPKRGFTESFLTDSAASLARSQTESRIYPAVNNPSAEFVGPDGSVVTAGGSAVRYTAAGNPIRGARKPHSGGPMLLSGVSERPSEQNRLYDFLASSYSGRPGSQQYNGNSNSNNSAKHSTVRDSSISRKTADSSAAQSEVALSDVAGGDGDKWRASTWGKLKKGVERLAELAKNDPGMKSNLYRAVTNGSLATSSLGEGYDAEDLDFASAQRDPVDLENSDADSDEEMWRSRSVYKVGKETAVKVGVWPRKPKKSYKLRYTWIPQPLVHNAVNNLYYEKTAWDFRQGAAATPAYDFQKELHDSKPKNQQKTQKSAMISIVEGDGASQQKMLRKSGTSGLYSSDMSPLGTRRSGAQINEDSMSDSSVSSSKYYKNFMGERHGSGLGLDRRSVGQGPNTGVMITAMMDGDLSAGSGSESEQVLSPAGGDSPARSSSKNQMKNKSGSNISFSLRSSEQGRSAKYDVISSPGSHSPTPSMGGKIATFSPTISRGKVPRTVGGTGGKGDFSFQPTSPLTSFNDLQGVPGLEDGGDQDNQSGQFSSPGASVSVAGQSWPGSGVVSGAGSEAWEAAGATPMGAFYSAKSTSKSKSMSRLEPQQENSDEEFACGPSPSNSTYFAEKPEGLSRKGVHKGVMFLEKDTTDPTQLRDNHYLSKSQRSVIEQQHASTKDAHVVLQPPPTTTSTSSKTTTHAPKFRYNQTTKSSTFNEAEALAKAVAPRAVSTKPPPPASPPPGTLSTKARANSSTRLSGSESILVMEAMGSTKREDSSKRLGKSDNIHPYSWA